MSLHQARDICTLLLFLLVGNAVSSAALPEGEFESIRSRFPLLTRAQRARETFPSVFAYENREREEGVKPWCIRVKSETDFTKVSGEEGKAHVLRCLPSWQIIGVYKVRSVCLSVRR